MRKKSGFSQNNSAAGPPDWCKSCAKRDLCQKLCRPLMQWLNGKYHARNSVKHINETDYRATVASDFRLDDHAAEGRPPRAGPPRRWGRNR